MSPRCSWFYCSTARLLYRGSRLWRPSQSRRSCLKSLVQFTRLVKGQKTRPSDLLELLSIDRSEQARWLCVGAHDDDVAGGEGMWVAAAAQAGIRVDGLNATDGRMGYCSLQERDTIVRVRKEEMYASLAVLGVAGGHIHYTDYPDADLF